MSTSYYITLQKISEIMYHPFEICSGYDTENYNAHCLLHFSKLKMFMPYDFTPISFVY